MALNNEYWQAPAAAGGGIDAGAYADGSDGKFHFYGMSTKGISVYELDMLLEMIEYGY